MDRKDWIVLPKSNPKVLGVDESYAKLLILKREARSIVEADRDCFLTDKQANAIQRIIENLIEAKACVLSYEDD